MNSNLEVAERLSEQLGNTLLLKREDMQPVRFLILCLAQMLRAGICHEGICQPGRLHPQEAGVGKVIRLRRLLMPMQCCSVSTDDHELGSAWTCIASHQQMAGHANAFVIWRVNVKAQSSLLLSAMLRPEANDMYTAATKLCVCVESFA